MHRILFIIFWRAFWKATWPASASSVRQLSRLGVTITACIYGSAADKSSTLCHAQIKCERMEKENEPADLSKQPTMPADCELSLRYAGISCIVHLASMVWWGPALTSSQVYFELWCKNNLSLWPHSEIFMAVLTDPGCSLTAQSRRASQTKAHVITCCTSCYFEFYL